MKLFICRNISRCDALEESFENVSDKNMYLFIQDSSVPL